MSIISRGAKAAGGTNFSTGKGTILSSEVDTDFNTLYTDYDGSITNLNISGSAGIVYSKLLLTNSIVQGDLTANSVGTSQLIALNVTNPKLAAGAASTQTGTAASSGLTIGTTTETTIITATAMPTTRSGAKILIFGTIAGIINIIGGNTMQVTVNLYSDTVPTLLRSYTTGGPAAPAATQLVPYMWPILDFDTGNAGTKTYIAKVKLDGTLGLSTFFVSSTSRLSAIEFA